MTIATKSDEGASNYAQKRRILIYEPYIFNVYGNTRYLLSIFKYYDQSRFEVILCSPYEHPFLDSIRGLGGRCRVVAPPTALVRYGGAISADSIRGRIRTAIAILRNGTALLQLLREERIDVVQCHSIRSLLTIGWCARWAKIPCFWYVKGDLSNGILDRIGFLTAWKILFQSPKTRDRRYPILRTVLRAKIGIIPNGIDFAELDEDLVARQTLIRKELDVDPGTLKIVVVGQISPLKGSDVVVSSLIEAKRAGIQFACYFVGDPVLASYEAFYQDLQQRIREANLETTVKFLGWRRDATTIVSIADLLIHASLSEGVPKAVIEAMASGVAVIATDVGGTADIVKNMETGALIPPNSVAALSNALNQLARDPGLRERLAKAGKNYARKFCSVVDNVKRLERVYDELSSS